MKHNQTKRNTEIEFIKIRQTNILFCLKCALIISGGASVTIMGCIPRILEYCTKTMFYVSQLTLTIYGVSIALGLAGGIITIYLAKLQGYVIENNGELNKKCYGLNLILNVIDPALEILVILSFGCFFIGSACFLWVIWVLGHQVF